MQNTENDIKNIDTIQFNWLVYGATYLCFAENTQKNGSVSVQIFLPHATTSPKGQFAYQEVTLFFL